MTGRKFLASVASAALFLSASAREVSVGTFVVNPGRSVTVPVVLDDASDLAYVGVRIAYDPQLLVPTKVAEGSLSSVFGEDFVAVQDEGWVAVSLFSSTNVPARVGGTLACVTFAVREGTAGAYSDVSISNADMGDATGVRDVTLANPVTTRHGMVRVMGAVSAATRLEDEQTVVAETTLGSLTLKAGDALQASDWPANPVVVSGSVSVEGTIPVSEPVNGWATGTYALLETPTTGLSLALAGLDEFATVSYSNAVASGVTTYYAIVAVPGLFEVSSGDADVVLSAGTRNQISRYAEDLKRQAVAALDPKAGDYAEMTNRYAQAKKIEIKGPTNDVSLVSTLADIGLSPALAPIDGTGTLKLTYEMPKLVIKDFNATTGEVRFKVMPGKGNAIVSEIAAGYVHVYGTDDIASPMTYVSKIGFDLSPYLKSETKGEGVLKVSLGSHTFLQVRVGQP